uniref:Laccase n=1 Tax=Pimpla hypochondriaca TaxID=135724 RepID=Q8WPD1_PIMHY|nr:laccase [Pimpla hypochondriaca]
MNLLAVGAVFLLTHTIGAYGDNDGITAAVNRKKNLFRSQINATSMSTPEECARACIDGEPPKTCYYHFTVEYYSTLTEACKLCQQEARSRVTPDCQCIQADGYEKSGLITVNRMYPGPGIMACLGDNIVVDVENRVLGNAVTVHFHGVYQRNYQYSDGVPFVTQCPIQEGSTFRYQWKAENSGTHLWHAHTGLHKGEGLMGPLIIREPKSTEPNHDLWDHDDIDNVIFLSDWFHRSSADHFPGNFHREPGQEPDNFLINGMGQWTDPDTGETTNTSYAHFNVTNGKSYKFRLINGAGMTCPLMLTIEGHKMHIIASDGQPLELVTVNTITSFAAERYDFVLNANKPIGNYWIQLRADGPCINRKMQQFAVLHYTSAPVEPQRSRITFDGPTSLDTGVILNPLNVRCFEQKLRTYIRCMSDLVNAKPIPQEILKDKADVQIFMNFGFNGYDPNDLFQPGRYLPYHVAGGGESVAMMGNISNFYPASPLLSQRSDIPDDQICSIADREAKCGKAYPCQCVHIERIPLNSVTELILTDEAKIANLSHPFHLHGQPFYLFGEGDADLHGVKTINVETVKELEKQGKLNRYPTSVAVEHNDVEGPVPPKVAARFPAKDTYAVPNSGYSIIRFWATNPGYWLFHCHFEFHALMGMMTIFHVGEPEDLPPVPPGFPKCGPYTPPLIF